MLKGAFSQSPGRDQELMPFVTQDVREMACAEESSEVCSGTSVSRSGDGGLNEQGFFAGRAGSTRWHAWVSFGAAVRAGKASVVSAILYGLSSPSEVRSSGAVGGEEGRKRRVYRSCSPVTVVLPLSLGSGGTCPPLQGCRLLPTRSHSQS